MDKFLMACGHVSNANESVTHRPVCVICVGTDKDLQARTIVRKCSGNDGLEGRKAKCCYGDKVVNSNWNLPFFEYRPNCEFDSYYCGCFGWD